MATLSRTGQGTQGRGHSGPSAVRVGPRAVQTQLIEALAPPIRKQDQTEQDSTHRCVSHLIRSFTETRQTCLPFFSFHLDTGLGAFSVSSRLWEPFPTPLSSQASKPLVAGPRCGAEPQLWALIQALPLPDIQTAKSTTHGDNHGHLRGL